MSQEGVGVPILPVPPLEYDRNYMDQYNRILRNYFQALQNPGPIIATSITLTDLPTSSAGLPSGALWNDSGTVKIV